MATMLDVSIRAGVSKATVSRVLNGTGQVKESTRQQVFKAMEELGYRPNFLARSLANRTSNSIGLVVSTFDGFYFGRLLQQASRQTEAWGKQLIVTDGHDAPEREEEAVQMLADRQCDAIVLYYGAGDEAWKFHQQNDLRKLLGSARERPLKASLTLLAEPPSDDKEVLIMNHEPLGVAVIGAGTAGMNAYSTLRKAGVRAVIIDQGPLGTTCARGATRKS